MDENASSSGAASAAHIVITVHGIRTFGQWQGRLERLVKEAAPNVTVFGYWYDYFSFIAFLLPFVRRREVKRFRKWLLLQLDRQRNVSRVDIVAHSFGTYIVAWALKTIPSERRPKINTLIFAGSVLSETFRWDELWDDRSVIRLVNECGIKDGALIANQLGVLGTSIGIAGRVGFTGGTNENFRNRYYLFGHDGFFTEEQRKGIFSSRRIPSDSFMKNHWVPLLTTDQAALMIDEREPGGFIGNAINWGLNRCTKLKVAIWFLIPLLLVSTVALRWRSDWKNSELARTMSYLERGVENCESGRTSEGMQQFWRGLETAEELDAFFDLDSRDVGFSARSLIAGWAPTMGKTLRHGSHLNVIAYDSIHGTVFTGGSGKGRLWSALTGQLLHELSIDGRTVEAVFSGDRTKNVLITLSTHGTVQTWNAETGEPLLQAFNPSGADGARNVAFSRNLGKVVVATPASTLRFRDTEAGRLHNEPLLIPWRVRNTAFSPDSKTLLVAGDGRAQLCDVDAAELRGHLFQFDGDLGAIAFSADSQTVAIATSENAVHFLDVTTGKRNPSKSLPEDTRSTYAFSANLDSILLGTWHGDDALLWDVDNARQRGECKLQDARIDRAELSPDAKSVVTLAQDGTLQLWDATTGRPRLDPLKREGAVLHLAISPDSSLLATVGHEALYIFDVNSGQPRHELTQSMRRPFAAFSQDSRTLLTANWEGFQFLDISTCASTVKSFDERHVREDFLSSSPDLRTVLTASHATSIESWNLATGLPAGKKVHVDHHNPAVAISPDASLLITGGDAFQIWDIATGQLRGKPLELETPLYQSAAFAPYGDEVAICSDGLVRLWDVKTGEVRGQTQLPFRRNSTRLKFSPNGDQILACSGDSARLLDRYPRREVSDGLLLLGEDIRAADFGFNFIILGGVAGKARLWDAKTGRSRNIPIQHPDEVVSVALGGDVVITGSSDGTVRVSSLGDAGADTINNLENGSSADTNPASIASFPGREQCFVHRHDGSIDIYDAANWPDYDSDSSSAPDFSELRTLVYSADLNWALLAKQDGKVQIWDVKKGAQAGELLEHPDVVKGEQASKSLERSDVETALAFSPDARRVLTGSRDGSVRLWMRETGTLLRGPIQDGSETVVAIAFLDSNTALVGRQSGIVQRYDLSSGLRIDQFQEDDASSPVIFSPDAKTVVTGVPSGKDKIYRLWDATAKNPRDLLPHDSQILSQQFSRDSKVLVTVCRDNTARLWNIATAQVIGRPIQHEDEIVSVAFSYDSQILATASKDHTVRLWDVTTGLARGEPLYHDHEVDGVAFTQHREKSQATTGERIEKIAEFVLEDKMQDDQYLISVAGNTAKQCTARRWKVPSAVFFWAGDDHGKNHLRKWVEVQSGLKWQERKSSRSSTPIGWIFPSSHEPILVPLTAEELAARKDVACDRHP